VKDTVCEARSEIYKNHAHWMHFFSKTKPKNAAGDHDRDNTMGKVQRQGLGEDEEYPYLFEYSNGGELSPPPPPPHFSPQ